MDQGRLLVYLTPYTYICTYIEKLMFFSVKYAYIHDRHGIYLLENHLLIGVLVIPKAVLKFSMISVYFIFEFKIN